MKRAIATVMSMALCVALVGCGGAGSSATAVSEDTASSTASSAASETESPSKEKKESNNDSPDIEGTVDYEITQGVDSYGDSSLLLTYANNTNHPIVNTQFYFDLKKDMTPDEEEVLKKLQAETEVSDDDLEYAYFNAYNNCYTEPGETSKPDSYTFYLNTIDDPAYKFLAGNERITIVYLAGNKLYSAYYNTATQSFTSPSPLGDAFEWFTSEKGLTIPALEGCPTDVSSDDSDYGFAYVYNVTLDTYETYIDTCKEAGYSKVEFDGGSSMSLSNDEGTELHIAYESTSNEMIVKFD